MADIIYSVPLVDTMPYFESIITWQNMEPALVIVMTFISFPEDSYCAALHGQFVII